MKYNVRDAVHVTEFQHNKKKVRMHFFISWHWFHGRANRNCSTDQGFVIIKEWTHDAGSLSASPPLDPEDVPETLANSRISVEGWK